MSEVYEIIDRGTGDFPGVCQYGEDWHFTVSSGKCRSLVLCLYDKSGKSVASIDMLEYHVRGHVYSLVVKGLRDDICAYCFVKDNIPMKDEYMKGTIKPLKWGEPVPSEGVPSLLYRNDYDWEDDKCPQIDYSDAVIYSLHVRGFTKHASSGVKNKGTFLGLIEKIDYLKGLGANVIEIMPSYDFTETEEIKRAEYTIVPGGEKSYKINYWGFKAGNYYMPKSAYGVTNPVSELKSLVKELHKNNMELIMQFYFPGDYNRNSIIPILRFWARDYHIDGFRLLGWNLPVKEICTDEFLMDCKLIFEQGTDIGNVSARDINPYVAVMSRDYSEAMRRFVKSDEDMIRSFLDKTTANPAYPHVINYITGYEGFTMKDLVSYDYKHNEVNGEENRDGNSINYSWNCGYEGECRKKSVKELRLRQIRNLFAMLILSQGTPMILSGDEFLNSQQGNNNAYCQDNDITWLNWRMSREKSQLMEYVRALIGFRRLNSVLHMDNQPRFADYKAVGFPDVSYHGSEAWYLKCENYVRTAGIMYCGKYGRDKKGEGLIYVAYNMYWKPQILALPKLKKGERWKVIMCSGTDECVTAANEALGSMQDKIVVRDRTVMVLSCESSN